jgi:hypothetical protein
MRRSLSLASVLIAVAVPLGAQSFPIEEIEYLARENAESYIRPAAEGLGHALTSGFAETALSHRLFGFDLGIRVMAALPSEAAKTFMAIVPESIEYRGFTFSDPYVPEGGSLETPTVMGDETAVVLTPHGDYRTALVANGEHPGDYNIYFPEGLSLPAVPFAVLQTSVGLPFDTEFTFRLVPPVTPTEDFGTIRAYGFGLKHTVTRWLPRAPVDVAVFAGTQQFGVGDELKVRASTYGMIVSRALGPLTAFAHVRGADANVSIGYTIENYNDNPALPPEGTRIEFDTKVPSGMRAGGGLTLRIVGLALTGEYTAGPQNTVSVKTGISIR